MRRLSIAAMLTVWLLPTSQARAGLYNTDEPLLPVILNAKERYPELLLNLQRVVAVELTGVEKTSRFIYLERVQSRERKLAAGQLSAQERINLSAEYVRLNEPDKAVKLLEAVPHKQRDWMLLSNLSTAYLLLGQLDRAESYLMEALEKWPTVNPETDSWSLNWLKIVEQHQLRLIRGRQHEQRTGGGPATSVDAIFPHLRFVAPSGEYEAGLLANDQWAKLPAHYMEIVQLLVLWMPHDARLRWLLAELVNANGKFVPALAMMDDLADTRGYGNEEFAEHRRVLRHAKDTAEHLFKLRKEFAEEHVANPLPLVAGLLPPGPDAALNAGNTVLALQKISQMQLPKGELVPGDIPTSPASNESPTANWTPEWRQITVSFVAGVIVALLLSMQLREMRKRKQDAAPAAKE